jgi:small subunit ribosomal protein S17
MSERDETKQGDETEASVEDTPETPEAAAPSVDEGEPMASTEAMSGPDSATPEPVEAERADADASPKPVTDDPAGESGVDERVPGIEAVPADEASGAQPEPEAVAEPEPAAAAEPEPAAAAEHEAAPEPDPVAEEPIEPLAEEPAPEPEPAPSAAAAETAAPEQPQQAQPPRGPKPKRKRLPRALRPQKTRPERQKSAERKPIVRLPKPEHEPGRRQERQGTVVSDKADKTIVVKVDTIKAHRRYQKVVRRSKRFHAHDERNEAKVGDVVRIVETRPLSKTKNWRLAEIVEAAK